MIAPGDLRAGDIAAFANAIHQARYPEAVVLFAAGSILRGEATPYSDLDLVVIFDSLPHAYRESFRFDGLPVEAFVHDPATLRFFFEDVDARSGVPSLPRMVQEGIEIPAPSSFSASLKQLAASTLDAGPPAWSTEDRNRRRYEITDQLDDLRAPRSDAEMRATGIQLYTSLADYYLRTHGLWSARGKAIPRAMRQAGAIGTRFHSCFEQLFRDADPAGVIALAEELLRPDGGLLFEGFRLDAPATWARR